MRINLLGIRSWRRTRRHQEAQQKRQDRNSIEATVNQGTKAGVHANSPAVAELVEKLKRHKKDPN